MGIDAGFDMVPCLSKDAADRKNWNDFIATVKIYYKDDPKVKIEPNYILFDVGEGPTLPFEGHKFLRFSSKVSGSNARVDSYIDAVTRFAKAYFGSRIQPWNDGAESLGAYSWSEVNESFKSYEQRDEPEITVSIASSPNGSDPVEELDIALFEVKEIPGKGKGLIARIDISKGTRILCEKPLLSIPSMSATQLEPILAKQLKVLPKESQRQFLSLHNNFPGKPPFTSIFKTNALPCGSNSVVGAIYPTICRINHSCVPNSHNNWNSSAEHETIHAIRPIKAGEEITIPYDRGGIQSARHAFLKTSFGFDCDCVGCTRRPTELHASNARRLMVHRLDDAIGDPHRMMNGPAQSLKDCHTLLQVLDDEFEGGAEALIARVYYDAFQISIAHGDQARASLFAERAYKARVICEGEDSPNTQRMQSLSMKPTDHDVYGVYSMKWKTKRGMVPKGLDTAQFEKWLFRE